MILANIVFCTEDDLGQILEVDQTSPYPWPKSVITRDLVVGDTGLSYIGAFTSAAKDKLLGYAVLGDEKGNGLLMNLTVLPEYRRRGLGTQLTVAAAECASDMRFPMLVLRVRISNFAALALYRRLGFKTDATRESFYSDGDVAQYMSVKLPLVIGE
ncbi:MAG: GNAT family N-acetyltransferase [Synergistaceae bacterium]|nr:GNAT family N-acetyltransferase [Synergistaceae bacterium]